MDNNEIIIEIKNLSKSYKTKGGSPFKVNQ